MLLPFFRSFLPIYAFDILQNEFSTLLISLCILSAFIYIFYQFSKISNLKKELFCKKISFKIQKEEIKNLKKEIEQRTKKLEVALQKAEESNRLKSLFLANMSHEIRTPLNGIMGFSELIIEEELDVDSKLLFASHINQNSQNLLRIIDQIFHLSIIETGKVTITKEEFLINDTIELILHEIQNKIKVSTKEIKLSVNIENKYYKIKTDKDKFKLILDNLFDNAIKFTTHGIIELTCLRLEKDFLFQITDSGSGLREDEYEIIFDPFIQGVDAIKKIKGGPGLGLSNVKNYVILLGGKIWCEKNNPNGSIFNFTLPAPKINKKELFEIFNRGLFQN